MRSADAHSQSRQRRVPRRRVLDRRRVEPGVLVCDQTVVELEEVKDPDLDRCALTVYPGPLAVHMPGDVGLVHHPLPILRCEATGRDEVDVGDGVDDVRIDGADCLLSVHRAQWVGHVVPDDVVGVSRQRGGDVVGVLCGKVLIDDVHGGFLADRGPPGPIRCLFE